MGTDTGLSFIHALPLTCFAASFHVCILGNEILYWYFCRHLLDIISLYLFVIRQKCLSSYMLLAGLGSVRMVQSYDLGLENQTECCPRPQPRATFEARGHSFFTIRAEPNAWVPLERILFVLPKIGSKL